MSNVSGSAHHGMTWAPTSRVGRWAVEFATAAFVGLVLSIVGFATGVLESAPSYSDNWLLTGWALAILASAAASVVAGAFAVLARHERSWSVVLATVLGLFALALLLDEVAQGL